MKHHIESVLILAHFIAFGMVTLFAVGAIVLALKNFSH